MNLRLEPLPSLPTRLIIYSHVVAKTSHPRHTTMYRSQTLICLMMDYIVCSANEIFFIAVTKCNLHSASTRLDFADDTFFFLVRFTLMGSGVTMRGICSSSM